MICYLFKGWIPGLEPGLITPQVTVLPLNYIHRKANYENNKVSLLYFQNKPTYNTQK